MSSFQHLFVNSMTNRRQLQYNIAFFSFFIFFFFTKCSEKKKKVRLPLQLQNALCTKKKGSSLSAAWTGESYILRQRLDSGRLLTFSSRINRTKTGTCISELYPGTNFPLRVFVFFLSFIAFSTCSRSKVY